MCVLDIGVTAVNRLDSPESAHYPAPTRALPLVQPYIPLELSQQAPCWIPYSPLLLICFPFTEGACEHVGSISLLAKVKGLAWHDGPCL
jgi:hypothetical protein